MKRKRSKRFPIIILLVILLLAVFWFVVYPKLQQPSPVDLFPIQFEEVAFETTPMFSSQDSLFPHIAAETHLQKNQTAFRLSPPADMDTLKETLLSFTGLFEYAYGANPETGEVGVLLNITYTPGERIARAYLTGNTYGLSAEETKALSEAKKLIGSKEFVSASIEDKERRIHDYICEKTTYYRGDDSAAVARHETALGIMLDGRGNCMAYTDAFLMLCKMAGFRVYAVGGTAFGGSEWEEHAWNIIKVDGEWVYADVTYDDAVGEGVSRSYEYYNVTAEKLSENHVWDMELTDKLITLWENIDDSVNN